LGRAYSRPVRKGHLVRREKEGGKGGGKSRGPKERKGQYKRKRGCFTKGKLNGPKAGDGAGGKGKAFRGLEREGQKGLHLNRRAPRSRGKFLFNIATNKRRQGRKRAALRNQEQTRGVGELANLSSKRVKKW